jgi:hypothetical protein
MASEVKPVWRQMARDIALLANHSDDRPNNREESAGKPNRKTRTAEIC